jgi:hypothetical protein
LLADITKSEGRDYSDYVASATLTGDFIINHMLDADLVLNAIYTNGTSACSVYRGFWSEHTGNLIEAFAVLADVTGDSKWQSTYEGAIYAATQKATWNGNDGVVTEGTDSDDFDARATKGMPPLNLRFVSLLMWHQAVILQTSTKHGHAPKTPISRRILVHT